MRKEDARMRKKMEQESINHMSDFLDEKNEEQFFDSFVHNMNRSLLIQKKGVMKLPYQERPTKVKPAPEQNHVVSENVSLNNLSPRLKEDRGYFKSKAYSMLSPNTNANPRASNESIELLSREPKEYRTVSPNYQDKRYQERMSLLQKFASAIKDTNEKPKREASSFLDTKSQRSRYSATAVDRRVKKNTFATQGKRVQLIQRATATMKLD